MTNTFRLSLGDPSNDGHGMYENHNIEANGTLVEIDAALKKLAKMGIDFVKLCENYEDDKMPCSVAMQINKLGLDAESYLDELEEEDNDKTFGTMHSGGYLKLFVDAINKVSPELKLRVVKEIRYNSIGTFGYGLFSH